MTKAVQLSLVIPAYNEEESIPLVYAEAVSVLEAQTPSFEIIFVNDGSSDGTAEQIAEIARRDPRVRCLVLARNGGKSQAYMEGFRAARGQLVATTDADLQDDLNELPHLREKLDEGHDLVIGWKSGRFKNEPTKAAPSFVFNFLIYVLFRIRLHDSNCGFRLMTRDVAKALRLHGGSYRFIPELAHLRGFRVTEVAVNHRKRKFGQSKYGPSRFWGGILDILSVRFVTAFSARPFHFFGTAALLSLLAGTGLEVYVLIQKLSGGTFMHHVAAIVIGALLIIVSLQIATTGLLGEMLAARYENDQVTCTEIVPRPQELPADDNLPHQLSGQG
jgi:dolichol-phosphate mannosyltransferase